MSDPLLETRLGGERVFNGRVVKLDVDRVRLPGGGETVREVVRHPGAVVIVPLLDGGRVAMVRQHRYAAGEALLELPAGTLDVPGEDPLACAQRELMEEAGATAQSWRLLATFYTTPGFTDERIHCFLAAGVELHGAPQGDHDETIDLVVLPLTTACAMARRGEIHDAKTIVGLMLAPSETGVPS